jgi:DNA-binding beta-propeller fold protein YncE
MKIKLHYLFLMLALFTCIRQAAAQQSYIYTPYAFTNFAGLPLGGAVDGTGNAARFSLPQSVTLDSSNNIFVADLYNHTVRKITPAGVVTTPTGNLGSSGFSDGMNTSALFTYPESVAVDGLNNVFVADNETIRKLTPIGTNWVVTTLAGSPGQTGNVDGTNSDARFYDPQGVAVDILGNIYVADYRNNTIRKIAAVGTNWVVTTIIGGLHTPDAVAVDSLGNIYAADNHSDDDPIYKIMPVGTNWVMTILARGFSQPAGLAVDNFGNVYVADYGHNMIQRITPAGVVTSLGGSGAAGNADGIGVAATFHYPNGIALDSSGNIYVADEQNNRITKGTPSLQFDIIAERPTISNGSFNARLIGSSGISMVVECSTNLQIWTPIQTNTMQSGYLEMSAPVLTPNQFYHAHYPTTNSSSTNILDHNLVLNPGFEAGTFANWTLSGNLSYYAINGGGNLAFSGNYSAWFANAQPLAYLSQTVPTIPGHVYNFSLWLYHSSGAISGVEATASWAGVQIADITNLEAAISSPLQYSYQEIATDTNTTISIGLASPPGWIGLDDVSVQDLNLVSAPQTVTQPHSQR